MNAVDPDDIDEIDQGPENEKEDRHGKKRRFCQNVEKHDIPDRAENDGIATCRAQGDELRRYGRGQRQDCKTHDNGHEKPYADLLLDVKLRIIYRLIGEMVGKEGEE